MLILIFFILAFNALIPTKWLRLAGVSLGDWVAIACYAAAGLCWLAAPRLRLPRSYGVWFLCLACVCVSVFACWASGGDSQYLMENGRQVLHYLFILPLAAMARTRQRSLAVLKVYFGIALAAAALLHVYHFFPGLLNWDWGTGVVWEGVGGQSARIFTPGMHYAFLALLGLLAYLPVARGYRALACGLAALIILGALAWTGIRAYFLILAACLGMLPLIMGAARRVPRVFSLAGAGLLGAALAASVLREAAGTVASRLDTLAGLRDIPFTQFETFGWRMLDAGNALSMIEGPRELLFGVFAKPYSSEFWFGAAPHVGYVGVVYHYGVLGAVAFAWLLLGTSRRLARELLWLCGRQTYDPLCTAAALVWVGLLLHTFIGGSFASGPAIISIAIIYSLSRLPRQQLQPGRAPS